MLNNIKITIDGKNIVYLSGEISFNNCMELKKKILELINESRIKHINLINLNSKDSSAVLLIINIIKLSKPNEIIFFNFSERITKLFKSYNLEHIVRNNINIFKK